MKHKTKYKTRLGHDGGAVETSPNRHVTPRDSTLHALSLRSLWTCLIVAAAQVTTSAHAADIKDARTHYLSGVVMVVGGMKNDQRGFAPMQQGELSSVVTVTSDKGRTLVTRGTLPAQTIASMQNFKTIASRVLALSPLIEEAARATQVDSALLMAVIDVESGGNPRAASPKGALGLMQLMPSTATRHGASNLFDPQQNIVAGARYLQSLIRQFGNLTIALAAYNAGEGAVQKYGGQVPPYAETMSYVPKVIERYRWYRGAISNAVGASVQDLSNNTPPPFFIVNLVTDDD